MKFNWFSRPTYNIKDRDDMQKIADDMNTVIADLALKDSLPPPEVTEPPPPAPAPHCHYSVGSDSANNVVLKVHAQSGATLTLTMNDSATRHMVRLLEAAIVESEDSDD
jgi:hypothetical protein